MKSPSCLSEDHFSSARCCEQCSVSGAFLVHAMTAYSPGPISPETERLYAALDLAPLSFEDCNPDLWLCAVCAEEYRSYWQERWDEYYAGLL